MKIGEKLSPVLSEIKDTLLEFHDVKPEFTEEGFKAAVFIFHSALMDKMFDLQVREQIPFGSMCDMATKCGKATRELIKTFTNIDMHELYKKND
jgi:hypothetical protein